MVRTVGKSNSAVCTAIYALYASIRRAVSDMYFQGYFIGAKNLQVYRSSGSERVTVKKAICMLGCKPGPVKNTLSDHIWVTKHGFAYQEFRVIGYQTRRDMHGTRCFELCHSFSSCSLSSYTRVLCDVCVYARAADQGGDGRA